MAGRCSSLQRYARDDCRKRDCLPRSEDALLRVEKVYLVRGNKLTGTYLVLENDAFVEKEN